MGIYLIPDHLSNSFHTGEIMKVSFSAISDDDSFDSRSFVPIKRKSFAEGGNPDAGVRRVEMAARRKSGKGSDSRNAEQRRRLQDY